MINQQKQRERNIQLTSILEDCKKEKYTVEKTLSELKEKINNGTYIEKSSANPTVLDMLNQKYQMENYKRETSNELNRLREEKSKYEVVAVSKGIVDYEIDNTSSKTISEGLMYLRNNYDSVMTISVVDEKDFGSEAMRHWELGGK